MSNRAAVSDLTVSEHDVPALRRVLTNELMPSRRSDDMRPIPKWICVYVCDAEGSPVGGLIGLVVGTWLSIDLLWLPPILRGRGTGSRLLAAAEAQASTSGCRCATVVTTDARACRFYERSGYTQRLVLLEVWPGMTQITLQKAFSTVGGYGCDNG